MFIKIVWYKNWRLIKKTAKPKLYSFFIWLFMNYIMLFISNKFLVNFIFTYFSIFCYLFNYFFGEHNAVTSFSPTFVSSLQALPKFSSGLFHIQITLLVPLLLFFLAMFLFPFLKLPLLSLNYHLINVTLPKRLFSVNYLFKWQRYLGI